LEPLVFSHLAMASVLRTRHKEDTNRQKRAPNKVKLSAIRPNLDGNRAQLSLISGQPCRML
jgi:hypothetical protein